MVDLSISALLMFHIGSKVFGNESQVTLLEIRKLFVKIQHLVFYTLELQHAVDANKVLTSLISSEILHKNYH